MANIVGKKRLTSREAARLLGVSEASVKRWAEEGLLPAEKTTGGHRRFRPEDVAAFRRAKFGRTDERLSQAAAAPGESQKAGAREAQRMESGALPAAMFESLIAGHAEEASAMLVNLHLRGHTVASIADGALCPPMQKIGDLWHAGELSIAQEHVATRTALQALSALRGAIGLGEPGEPTAICCSVEDDFHELPIHISALLLEAEGWDAVTLGASTPFYALAEAVLRFRPRLVCVASTVLGDLDRAAREYGELREAVAKVGASVVLGGAGFAGEVMRQRFPAELHADSFAQLEAFAPTLASED
ncbi:MAG: helix-turn-helix domain-containing protein [Rubrivivax sp.]|nr:helix-turn-helix domain-containing protein [Pyrinomonadaceae bacterium]